MSTIAVIGAGLSGLVVARGLARHHDVTVFEKSRGVGGRMATRYAGEFEFDHGAQFFTARTRDFQQYLQPYIESGFVAVWGPQFAELHGDNLTATRPWDESTPHYVASPRMNSLANELALDLDIRLQTEVASVAQAGSQWSLRDLNDAVLGSFDWLVVAIPAAQTAQLAQQHTLIAETASGVEMLGCYALMLGFDASQPIPWQAALVRGADISWISVNSSKPGRADNFTIVVHSTNAWAQAHIEDEKETVRAHLVAEVSRVTGIDCCHALHCDLQRWRYANIGKRSGPECVVDPDNRIAACGDWFIRGRVEAAFTSAQSVLDQISKLSG